MEQTKIVVLGNLVADVVARPVDEVPRTGSLHPEAVTFHTGGCAGNVAGALARLGVRAELVGCVGQDALGTALLEAWQARGIRTAWVQRVAAGTGIAIVLVDSAGERRFISTPGANDLLVPADLTDTALDGAWGLHVGGFFAVPGLEDGALAARLAAAQARGIHTSLDPVGGSARERRAALFPLLPHLDLLLLNEDEGEKLTDEREPEAMIAQLQARGARTIVFKEGKRGCRTVGAWGTFTVPALPATCVDSTGAGDAFAAALLASLARGDDFHAALRWASAAGAATVEALGAAGAWRGWTDLARRT